MSIQGLYFTAFRIKIIYHLDYPNTQFVIPKVNEDELMYLESKQTHDPSDLSSLCIQLAGFEAIRDKKKRKR